MSTAHSIMLPSEPRLTTTSFSASASSRSPLARADRRGEQRAPLLDVAAVEHRVERGLHPRQRNVGQEAQAALVDADQRHVVRRQLARDREHRAVAAQHDREVGSLPPAPPAGGRRIPGHRRVARGLGVEDDVRGRARPGTPRARASGAAMPGLAWRPTRATRGKRAGAAARAWPRLNHRRAAAQSPRPDGRASRARIARGACARR